jgi:hypothetical protein
MRKTGYKQTLNSRLGTDCVLCDVGGETESEMCSVNRGVRYFVGPRFSLLLRLLVLCVYVIVCVSVMLRIA